MKNICCGCRDQIKIKHVDLLNRSCLADYVLCCAGSNKWKKRIFWDIDGCFWLGHSLRKFNLAMERNSTTDLANSEDRASQSSTYFAVVLIFTSVVNITSNVLVLVILARNNRLRTFTNCFIANLCVVDLIAGIVVVPATIDSLLTKTEPRSNASLLCRFYGFLNSLYGIASSLTVAVIALDRYHSILNCLRYEVIVTQRRTVFVVAWTWLQAFFVSSCPLLGWGHFLLNPYQRCPVYFPDLTGFIFFKTISCVLLPYFITVFCYSRIHLVARRHAKTIVNIQVRDAKNRIKGMCLSGASKKTLMVYIVLGVYTTCWLPFYGIDLLMTIYPRAKIPETVILTTTVLTLVNSACNPIMYALITSQFRGGLKRVYRQIRRSIFAGDSRQINLNGPRGDSRSSWTFTRSSAKRIFAAQEPAVRPRLACAVIREESSMNAKMPDKTSRVVDSPATIYPLTLQVPEEKGHKSFKTIKNGWTGDGTQLA